MLIILTPKGIFTIKILMRGYKIFGPDYTCKDFKYSLTEPNLYTGDLNPCKRGFHFCVNPIDCLQYYSYTPENTYAIVESGDEYIVKKDKVVCNNLTITPLSYEEFGNLLTGDRIIFYDEDLYDNQIYKKYTYVCGVLCEYTEFFGTGRMAKKYKYVNGKIHGECIDYHKNGQMSKTCNYVKGVLHGEWKMGYENGEIMKTCNYVNGIRSGECKEYYTNGIEKAIYTYVEDEIEGECIDFYESGKLLSKSNYDKDRLLQGIYQKWYENGQLWIQCNYKDDEKHGTYKSWFPDGRLSLECNYVEGWISGQYHKWYIEDGNYIHTFNM